MAQDITQQNVVELRERQNRAGGISDLERQAALLHHSTTVYQRMALEKSSPTPTSNISLASASQGLSMPAAPTQINPSLPGIMPNREAMLGVLAPQGPRPMITTFQQVSMPPISQGQPNQNQSNDLGSFSPSFKGGGDMFSSLSTPPAQAQSKSNSTLSPLAPGPETGPFQHAAPTPTQTSNETQQKQSNTFENLASNLGQINPGNIWKDLTRGINPILQLGKDILHIVTGSIFAFINLFFKPNK